MYCLIIILSLWLVRSGAQQVGQLIGPAVDDPRAMLGQENFPPGGALGNAYYGLLTVCTTVDTYNLRHVSRRLLYAT